MAEEKIYPKGIIAFAPREGAKDFDRGSVIISEDFINWFNENKNLLTEYKGQKQLRLAVTSWEGRLSFKVDTYKSNGASKSESQSNSNSSGSSSAGASDDLPF